MRIRVKFLLVFFVSSFLPLVFLAYVNFSSSRHALIQDTQHNLEVVAKLQALRVDEIVGLYKFRIDSQSSQLPRLEALELFNRTGDTAVQDQMVRSLLDAQAIIPEMETMSIMDTRGRIVASTNRDLIGTIQAISTFSSLDFIPLPNAAPQIRLRRQMVMDGFPVGEMEIVLRGDLLPAITDDYSVLGETGEIELVTRLEDGSVEYIARRRFGPDRVDSNAFESESPLIADALKGKGGFFLNSTDYRGESVVAAAEHLESLDWVLVVKIDTDEAFRSVSALRDVVIIFSFVFILLIVLNALLFVYSITAPILSLVSVAEQVGAGNLSIRGVVRTRDEIGELTKSLNSMIGTLQESHENLEKKVAERTEQLAVANRDLEAFTYSVSHDLRAPLRSIDGFSKILQEDYAKKIDAEGGHVIATIREGARRMGSLIDDLLAFSRLGRQEIKTANVDMRALATTVFEELRIANPGRAIQFSCADLPVAYADPALMRQVWTNLLSNAVKFTRRKDVATIAIGSAVDGDSTNYFVRDNGVGFDMKYVGNLFVVFQRLHSTQDFEGSGVGLSIVARIVQKHGGRVWAEGAVDRGATFSFSLPNDGRRTQSVSNV